jgi:catechol 2,3-dioxygenase-like lactoylglutathione lyase family enzyme
MHTLGELPGKKTTAGVHSLHEFVFTVPDLTEAETFYRHFGLDVRRVENTLELYTYGHPQRWARILPGENKKLAWISWGAYSDDIPIFKERLLGAKIPLALVPPRGADAGGLWFEGPDGVPHQLVAASKSSPDIKSPRIFPPDASPSGRAPRRSQQTQVRPTRLSHILLFTADVDASVDFYLNVLGLRLSDRSGSIIAFMHGMHGSDHHLVAVAKSGGAGLHHSSWDVSSLDDVGLGCQQMCQAGYGQGWGLGRHVLGSNYFRYVRDPWGGYAEYSFDIDYISAGADWPAADYPPEDSFYGWGPPPPAEFVINYEMETLPKEAGNARHAVKASSAPAKAD